MRPRINNTFGIIKFKDLDNYFFDNAVYGFTATRNEKTIVYSYHIMFRNTKKDPEMIYVEVSRVSKLVLKSWTNRGRKFNNIDELKTYTKR